MPVFLGRLEQLGYSSYAAYLNGAHWRGVRARYAVSDRPQDCALCGAADDLDLHHLTYARVGAELLTDLVRLCRRCHRMVHVLHKRGVASLDLDGIVDRDRAIRYMACRAEAIERAKAENAAPRKVGLLETDFRMTMSRAGEKIRKQRRKEWFIATKKHRDAYRKGKTDIPPPLPPNKERAA